MTQPITPERLDKLTAMVRRRQRDIVLVLEDIHDPHNAEAAFRTCDAFGIQTVHLIFEQQPPFNPRKVGKATSSSANKWLDFVTHRSTQSALDILKSAGYRSIATTLRDDAISIYDTQFTEGKWAIWIGNEHRGLSDRAQVQCEVAVKIPMAGLVQSLNLSVTAALLMYEATRQRVASNRDFYLTTGDQAALLDALVSRSRRTAPITKLGPGDVPTLGKFGPDQ
ncbi:RNA methyltransferase [bacterium]|nr:RNA methyltransferase [bacterium]